LRGIRPHSLHSLSGYAAAVAGRNLPALAPVWANGRWLLRIADHVVDRAAVALTFDDGPHPQGTRLILDVLSEWDVRATFFLVGAQVAKWPALAAQIAARGHEIGVHGYDHRVLPRLSGPEFREDLRRAAHVISSATGRAPVLYRPPRGVLTYEALAVVCSNGWHPVLWAADGRDWRRSASPASIARRVTAGVSGGEIVLLHDADHYSASGSWKNTCAAMPFILEAFRRKGLAAVPLAAQSLSRAG
jgi:peptidoglycan/xylan/chitin deacetylase (PgdA/CDA1 family)